MTNFGGRTIGLPVFLPHQHLELKQLRHKPIHVFLRERMTNITMLLTPFTLGHSTPVHTVINRD